MKRNNIFKGLTGVFGSVLAVCAFMTQLAFLRAGDINLFLHITTGQGAGTGGTYDSAYKTKDEMLEAEKDYLIQTEEEGSVLLKNDSKNGLPFDQTAKVTLFGNAAVNTIYHGGSGGPSNEGVNLKDALTAEGVAVNDKVYSAISAAGTSIKDHDISEVPASTYSTSDFSGYTDAAIYVISRYGGEQNDPDYPTDTDGVPELSLHDVEKDTLNAIKAGGFKKIIVLLNTGYAMDLGWLDEYGVNACLWIGFPGGYGMTGVAKMLTGQASPSGKLVDTYATCSYSSPAMQNYGDFKWNDLDTSLYHDRYVVYAEDIYVGYKYYETRYADSILNPDTTKATANYGVFAGEGKWDYDTEVQYTFGYGLTYTNFTQTVKSMEWDKENHLVKATVDVTNTGNFAAKSVVELYASLPYQKGQAQKSAIQVIGMGKTNELQPNATETVNIEASDYLFATYDQNATNGADTTKKGCYTFDAGDYYFAIGDSAHDALNNVLALEGKSGMTDGFGTKVTGNKDNAVKVNLAEYDNTTYATNPTTGTVVSNQFDDIDLNYYEKDTITYLTRDDWSTFPKSYTGLKADDDPTGTIRKKMTQKADGYTKPSDAPAVSDFKYRKDSDEVPEKVTKFYEMASVPYSGKYTDANGVEQDADQQWSDFIDELSVAELMAIPGETMANAAIEYVAFPGNSSGDGPDGLQSGGTLHVCENLAAATWNTELLEKRGDFLAEDAFWGNLKTVYGGGANLHRTPYGGRNFEYYSEDANIAYIMGRHQATHMAQHGLVSCFKHFLGNDQETNRHGVATFMTEQTLRLGDARSFEGALSDGGSLANMGAYNRIGLVSASNSKALMTTMLRDEWGFKGISMTDSSKDAASYLFTGEALDAGVDQFNNDSGRSAEIKTYMIKGKDGYIWKKTREIAKHFFYAYSRSMLVNGLTAETVVKTVTPWWQTAVWALDISLGVATVGCLAGYVLFTYVFKKKDDEKEAN